MAPARTPFLRTPWGIAAAVLDVAWVAFAAWVLQQPSAQSPVVRWVDLALGTASILVFLAAATMLARRASGRLRNAWLLLAAGQAALETADVLYTILGYPAVSVADGFYLALYPLTLAGVLMMPFVPVSRPDRLLLALDRLLVLAAGATLIWFTLASTVAGWSGLTAEGRLNLVYPPLELILLAAGVTLIQRDVAGVHRLTLSFLAFGFACGVASTLVDVHSIVGNADKLEVVWLAVSGFSYAAFASAAAWQLVAGERSEGLRISGARRLLRTALPYFAVATSMLVLALAVVRGGPREQVLGVLAGAAATTALLLYRQHLVLRENVRLYEDLDAARARLEGQNETLREHVRLQADVERLSRHDLKTPLAGIIALPQMIRQAEGQPARREQLLQMIERAGYRLLGLINLSLDLLRMEQGGYRFEPAVVDLAEVIRRAAFDLEGLAASRRVELRLGPGTPLHVWAEELLSYSMIANLVRNAIEASPEGAPVSVSCREVDGEVRILVHNQGAVPLELRDDFFEKYRTAGKAAGTGLGTYSARLMAETQRGRIGMSTGETGTTVEVVLAAPPRDAAAPLPAARPVAEPGPPRPDDDDVGALRVLVVDDDFIGRTVLHATLPSPPLVVQTATDGRDAVERLEGFRPELVFMDLEMPVMDGVEAVTRIREWEDAGSRPRSFVVGISAHDDAGTERRFRAAGCDRYLVRPAEPEQILALVREASDRLGR